MPQLPIVGPLGEADLRHEIGPHPVRPLVRFRLDSKRRSRNLARLEQLRDALELGLIEAGSGVSDVRELVGLRIMDAEQ